ncbi:sugar phosphate isomerase/epimerase family protein [Celeribacter neptunius]|uniref:Protein FrlC n=1 Tax=Celeribacter neptunius TaxID=588602 RepID=A0A1I3TUF5_9RHOB|nr:sugar phosphate isomerase/epimerase family protein [Celeribacter neptunius]SFJ74262.1 protein FrlC [Celeribacter neptunius]
MKHRLSDVPFSRILGSNFSFQHAPFELFAKEMHRSGMTRIELWAVAPHLHVSTANKYRIRHLKNCLRENDLSVHCLTPEQVMYPVNIASKDPELRANSIDYFCKAAEFCAELGGEYLFLTSGRGCETENIEEAWSRSLESLSQITEFAASLGLKSLLEPLQRCESNLVISAASALQMLKQLSRDDIDVVLDFVAMATAGDDIATYIELFGDRLAHVHLVDGKPSGHLALGDGELNIPQFMHELTDGGYTGTFSFEPFGDGSYALDPIATWRRNLSAISPWINMEESFQ